MSAITIFCRRCQVGYAVSGPVPAICPACEEETTWTTVWPKEHEDLQFRLTDDDRAFLRSIRISGVRES